MPPLPERPDLDQLRRQARELLRAAQHRDTQAIARMAAFAAHPTLWAAQLAIAREHGFTSWTALKAEVERRRAPVASPDPMIRPVASPAELAKAFDVIGAQFEPALTSADRRFTELAQRFVLDRSLMLVVCEPALAGGALAFRTKSGDTALRIIGLPPRLRGRGLGRRLVDQVAAEAARFGSRSVAVGGVIAADRGFYERMGFHGRRSMMRKDLPFPRLL